MDLLVSYADGRHDRMREILRPMMASTGQARIAGYNLDASLDLLEGRAAAWERRMREKDSLPAPQRKGPGLRTARLLANYWVFNRPDQGLSMLEESVGGDPTLRFDLGVSEYYAQLGAPDSARALLAARGTQDQSRYYRGTDTLAASAWIDLAEGRPRDAAAKFRESLRFLGGSAPSQTLRDAEIGLAFERAGAPDSAIAGYEHYLNAAPVWDLDIYRLPFVLEHVAALYDKKGDRRKARAAYERLAEMWKDADAELQPRVRHARDRAAVLR